MQTYLPFDTLKHIFYHCDIHTLKIIILCCKTLNNLCDKVFWIQKFLQDDLIIITPGDNFNNRITEYNMISRSKFMAVGIMTMPDFYFWSVDIYFYIPNYNNLHCFSDQIISLESNVFKITIINRQEFIIQYASSSARITYEQFLNMLICLIYRNEQLRFKYGMEHINCKDYSTISTGISTPLLYDELRYLQSKNIDSVEVKYQLNNWLNYFVKHQKYRIK